MQTLKQYWNRFWVYVVQHDIVLSGLASAGTALIGIGIAWENNKVVPAQTVPIAHYLAEPHNRLSFLANWDGADYIHIAVHGYQGVLNTNFFPLYPLLIRLVNIVIPSPLDSALLLSWAAFFGATYFYLKIIKHLYRLKDNSEALRGVLFFLFFPTAAFLFTVYTESLFACLTLGVVYFSLQKRYLPATCLALLAASVHDNGIFVVVLLAFMMWEQRAAWSKIAASVVVGSLGLISYMAYLAIHFHNALGFVSAQKNNGWLHYAPASLGSVFSPLKLLFLISVAISVYYWWPKRKSFAVYSLLFVGIFFLGGSGAYGRYSLLAFPVQIMLYEYLRKRKLGYSLALVVTTIFWMFFLLQFAAGYNTGG